MILLRFVTLIGLSFLLVGCFSNRPYPNKEKNQNIYYSDFDQLPKYLEPARSYSADEYRILALIYEPPLQFHYLKRPYTLDPLTLTEIPTAKYFDRSGNQLSESAPESQISRVVYHFHLKSNIFYQDHPAFAKDQAGDFLYHRLSDKQLASINQLSDFREVNSRELVASDYELQIKRLASPLSLCPIAPTLAESLEGFKDYQNQLIKDVAQIRADRKKNNPAHYLQDKDEKEQPLKLSLSNALPAVNVLGKYDFEIVLNQRYPQILYWMTLPFFAPMPWEALEFYSQSGLVKKNITLNRCPIGTGPYYLSRYEPNRRIELNRNLHFNHETYPMNGEPGDVEKGLLVDAGKPLPFIDKIVMSYEKESIPRWNKFLQGYYDFSGVSEDNFDKVVQMTETGTSINKLYSESGISLLIEPASSISYWGFNMLDPVVGGLSDDNKKLRRAISLTFDVEEYIQIFLNGRGLVAKGPLPPEIQGHAEMGINTFLYEDVSGHVVKKNLELAKQLLKEAGYPDGMGPKGPLVLYFDGTFNGPGSQSLMSWLTKQFQKLNIQLQFRNTTYRQFREKMEKGTGQIFTWGWNADYPDSENFLFLLYGPNKMAGGGGENAANYNNPAYNKLFEQMRNLPDSPLRLNIVKEMTAILQEDAPWIWGVYPVTFALKHQWIQNVKLGDLANNQRKYHKLDVLDREKKQAIWNQPRVWPLYLFLTLLVVTLSLVFILKKKGI